MHILMLTPQVPYPPRQGTALRNWGILRGLAAQHHLTLLTFAAPDQPTTPPDPVRDVVHDVTIVPQPTRTIQERFRDLIVHRRPDLAMRLKSATFRSAVANALKQTNFDWVLVEGLEMAPYLDEVWGFVEPPLVIFDAHNCEYLLQKRAFITDLARPQRWIGAAYSFVQWQRLRRYERAVCQRADILVSVSEADARALRQIVPNAQPLMMPNGIMVADYADFTERATLEQPAFVFTGTMDFRPNVDGMLWFADQVWPTVREALPDAHCYVVGRHPHRRLDPLRALPGFVITGAVPEIQPFIGAATVYIVPLLVGGGTRLKIIEASAMGKAIVSTSLGAEGFPDAAEAMVLADTPAAFAEACVRLAQDAAERKRLAQRARDFAWAYDWDALLPKLLARL